MRMPTDDDFAALESWGLATAPFAAVADFSPEKLELRWNNPVHRSAHDAYVKAREEYIQTKDFDHYYKTARKPIDRRKWEYLKERKAWFICPLEWDRFAEPGVERIVDLGCGDGDVAQRVADHIAACWNRTGYAGHEVEISGYDLNASRVENARALCRSPHPLIRFAFADRDIVSAGAAEADKSFDHVLCTGVLEILADGPAERMLDEMCRLARLGVYIEDLADVYPGGFPRDDLPERLARRGFRTVRHVHVLTEPFDAQESRDPLRLWPILKDQVLFAEPAE